MSVDIVLVDEDLLTNLLCPLLTNKFLLWFFSISGRIFWGPSFVLETVITFLLWDVGGANIPIGGFFPFAVDAMA